MNKTFKVKNNKIEIKKNVWVDLDKNTIFKKFPKIKKPILKRECLNKITEMIVVPNIDFKIFSKLKNLEELGIIDDELVIIDDNSKSTKIYLNFLEILKLKKLKKLYIYTPYVSTKDLMKIFNKKAGVQEKFIFNYNLNHSSAEAEFPPMIYEEEFDEKSWKKYNDLRSKNVESNFEIALYEKQKSEISLLEVAVFRMREDQEDQGDEY